MADCFVTLGRPAHTEPPSRYQPRNIKPPICAFPWDATCCLPEGSNDLEFVCNYLSNNYKEALINQLTLRTVLELTDRFLQPVSHQLICTVIISATDVSALCERCKSG